MARLRAATAAHGEAGGAPGAVGVAHRKTTANQIGSKDGTAFASVCSVLGCQRNGRTDGMQGYGMRALLLAVALWLGGCGAGGNNNIFDLIHANRPGVDSGAVQRAALIGFAPGTPLAGCQTAGDTARFDRLGPDLVAQIFHRARVQVAAFDPVDEHGGVYRDIDQVV